MAAVDDPRAALAAELSQPEPKVSLGRAALLIASEEYQGLDVDSYVARLDDLAAGVKHRLTGDEGPASILASINAHLYGELGFRGNRDDYYDPRNSYLNEVLDRRTGIPISLAVVYAEIARRLGHRLVGLNLPLHFVLGWPLDDDMLIVDAFENGAILDKRDCADRLSAFTGRPVQLSEVSFTPVGPRTIVRRILNNLCNIYVQREDFTRALAAVERMHLVLPIVDDMRDRGLLLFRLKRYPEADDQLSRYLANAPTAPDREAIQQHLDLVRRFAGGMN